MKRFFLVPALGVAAFVVSTRVEAQQFGSLPEVRPAYADDRQPYYEARRVAYDNGYREGMKEGERDGRRRDSYHYQDNRTWQRAEKGYNRSFGDFERYRQQFRAGFSEGYQAGYSRYGQSGGAPPPLRLSKIAEPGDGIAEFVPATSVMNAVVLDADGS